MSGGRRKLGPLYVGLDLVSAEAAFFSAVVLRYGYLHPIPPFFNAQSYVLYSILVLVICGTVLWATGTYRDRIPTLGGLLKSAFAIGLVVNLLPFYFQDFAFSRKVFLAFPGLTLVFGILWRLAFTLLLDLPAFSRLVRERALLVAARERLDQMRDALTGIATPRYELVGQAAGDSGEEAGEWGTSGLSGIISRARELAADTVLLDPEGLAPELWLALAARLSNEGLSLRLFVGGETGGPLDLSGRPAPEAGEILVEPIMGFQAAVKRGLDILVSVGVLLAALPFMLAVALAIKVSSRGPVLYTQERVGRNGRAFRLRKFRSMVHEAERHTGPVWSRPQDERIVPGIGSFIRRTGLDELPQFWNVLRGDMSLVGPRPERAFFFSSYPELFRGRLAVRPGLTGLAQLVYRESRDIGKKVSLDLKYIRNYSLALDIEILWQTLVMLIKQEFGLLRGDKPE